MQRIVTQRWQFCSRLAIVTLMRAIGLLMWLGVLVPSSEAAIGAARIVSFSGDVKVNGLQTHVGAEVPAGHVIRTGADGLAKLLLVDKSIVDLARNTAFTIESSEPDVGSVTKLDFGMVRSSIQKKLEKKIKFQMRTKTSVLAVRGTEFIVRSALGGAGGKQVADQVTVRDGQVAVGIGSSVPRMLNAGDQMMAIGRFENNQVKVDMDQIKVAQIKPEAMAALTSQATVQDQTFNNKVEVSSGTKPGAPGGEATLAVAAATVMKEAGPPPGSAPGADGKDGKRPPPPPPPPMGSLNAIDQSTAQNRVIQGIKLNVNFIP